MYGLVNRALQGMVVSRFGEVAWERIKVRAGVDVEVFLRMDAYPDDITYRLVGAACEETGESAGSLLHDFGEYWTLYTAEEGYGELLTAAGHSLHDVLGNLNELHTRVGLLYPDLKPPTFECSDITPDSLVLHYHSTREGLAPMVVGLLHGLGKRFRQRLEVAQLTDRATGADHDSFSVRILGPD